jgi:hypothetical protein
MTAARKSLLACALWLLAGCATPPGVAPGVSTTAAPEEALGVKVEGVRLSAAGYMLDLRYRVLDVEKARVLFERGSVPQLHEEATGARFIVPNVPKLGQLRTTSARNVKANRSYSILFANPGRYVERGQKVSLVVGAARIDGLVIE